MKKIVSLLLSAFLFGSLCFAEETSFRRVRVLNTKGNQDKAVLTFSDDHRAVEIRSTKGDAVTIPYGEIDKCSYEYTKKHRITQGVLLAAVSPAAGIIVFFTKSKSHWLEIDYHEQDASKVYLVRMDKHDYVHVLEAVKNHTGKDAEVLGNVNKREK